jgi:hypothetical protein
MNNRCTESLLIPEAINNRSYLKFEDKVGITLVLHFTLNNIKISAQLGEESVGAGGSIPHGETART